MPPVRFNPATISLFRSIDVVKIIDAIKFVKIREFRELKRKYNVCNLLPRRDYLLTSNQKIRT